ncbi:helix-turn-helix domain-containing protein [Streptomyces acidiscabies]|uniref:DNA-binding protein n=1 Tax=Streptomyces acidiscabies TaxID=42234 RepID=A0A0L0KJC7_9ACTN|nr:helix-turn-helix transcriptional regulator [Streptomyces acidiscabies]KND38367.1 DNA-binding protein [Streptomyces acidiscabies]
MDTTTYGQWIKERREELSLTQQEVADRAIMSRTHIAHIEAGRRTPSKEDARRLDRVLQMQGALIIFRPGREEEEVVPDYFSAVLILEQQAVQIREFGLTYFPGLLQTERYARAVLGQVFPPISDEERDKRVVTRLERQRFLESGRVPAFWVLLDEMVLRRPVASADIMAEQITHVADLAESGRIRVHVLPFGAGHHPLLGGMLTLMWFDDQPPLAYSEGNIAGKLYDSPSLVEQYQHRYDLALSDALPLQESVALLRAAAKDCTHHD